MKSISKISDNLVKAFIKGKVIRPIPNKYCKNLNLANKFRKICEQKIDDTIVGFKAGGTAIPVLKKLKEKEPFYAAVFKKNLIKSGKKVEINKYCLGIELEVCFLVSKKFFFFKKVVNLKNIRKFILKVAPCLEIVGYRQKKKGIKYLGDLSSDFGANVKFILGKEKKKIINTNELFTSLSSKKNNQLVKGNTNTVYINPINSLKFVLGKLKKDQVKLDRNFYVFTGSTVGVVPIIGKGIYIGKIKKLGSVKSEIK